MFGERLKKVRKDNHITQTQLGKQLGFYHSAIVKWEKGISEPNFDTLLKIAAYFNVSIDYLLGRSDDYLPIKRPEYALAEKFATDYKQLLTDKSFQDITAMCNEITDEQRALICGYVAGLLQNWGVNVQSILHK